MLVLFRAMPMLVLVLLGGLFRPGLVVLLIARGFQLLGSAVASMRVS